ncbi:hypothetical protein ACFYNY_24690 [Streptomyces sp. NPDC006530]|uniref:hypothetical protein n=1 Tax=Streptomyces sp. NPDC006530 TaxID=3364750 RepID=UPI0036B05CA2
MVEVDAFWAYAIGAGCALSTAEQLQPPVPPDRQRAVRDRQLAATLLFMGLLFAPMGIWLAVRFPGWETMYLIRGLPPWGMGLFNAGITLCAVLGHLCTHRLLVNDRTWAAVLQLLMAYTGVFFVLIHGWDGTGLHRFLAPAPQAEYSKAPLPSWAELAIWLRSPVPPTLLAMGLVLVPSLLWLNTRSYTQGLRRLAPVTPPRRLPGLLAVSRILLVILGPCPALALAAGLAITEWGVVLGGVLWAACAAVLLRPQGALAAHCRRLVLPSVYGPRTADVLPASTAVANTPAPAPRS